MPNRLHEFFRIVLQLAISISSCSESLFALEVSDLRCEFRLVPKTIDVVQPRLGWQIRSERRGILQEAYRIQVASSPEILESGQPDLWDSERTVSQKSQLVPYNGKPLLSRQECWWRVKVWDQKGQVSNWSTASNWTIGLLNEDDWQAKWICKDTSQLNKNPELDLPPSPYLRKDFRVSQSIKKATLYITALGLYEVSINGRRVSDHRLAPGWTDYKKRVYYQTYDVTNHVREGDNAIGAILSGGWYSGYVGFGLYDKLPQAKGFYGDIPALLCQLEIELTDGSRVIVESNDSWTATTGPILESDIQMGVTYDARKELSGWNEPSYDSKGWQPVEKHPGTIGNLEAQPHEPVRITQEMPAKRLLVTPDGNYIFDFGQNFAGTVKLSIQGEEGQTLILRYGEMLHPDGRLMTENLRKARATDTYVCSGKPRGETWTPRFTFHGFQYAEIRGLKKKPSLSMLTGLVLESDTEVAGEFLCSSPIINQLHKNISWTQRSNFIDIPTDCPQRDERLGWTGDAQIYVRSATWNRHVPSFFSKWARDCADAQRANGSFPNFVPSPYTRNNRPYSPAWMEAGIICPKTMHEVYADHRILEENYDSFRRFAEFHIEKVGPSYIYTRDSWSELDPAGGWGDWLFLGRETPKEIIATFYFGKTLQLMSEIADITNHLDDANKYREHLKKYSAAILKAYLKSDGKLEGDTQTVYAIAISMGLFPRDVERRVGARLVQLIEEAGGKMQTGFLGTKYLLPALTKIERTDLAYKLLASTDYPGWGYEVVNGATTVWERWNSYTRGEGFGEKNASMNSFSHYAFGAVCEWMFEHMAGIQAGEPGFQKIVFRPQLERHSHISWTNATYHSYYGPITCQWKLIGTGEYAELFFSVPANTTATAIIPCSKPELLSEGGKSIERIGEIRFIDCTDDFAQIELGSGDFKIRTSLPPAVLQGSEAR